MSIFLGVDFGTSGVRLVAIDEANEIIGYSNNAIPPPIRQNKSVTQNPNIWWHSFKNALKILKTQIDFSRIYSISIDGTSGTILATSKNGIPKSSAHMYNDAVGVKQGKLLKKLSNENPVVSSSSNALARALFIKEMGDLGTNYIFLHQADWIAGKLLNKFKYSDENNALKLGYDCINRKWPDWFSKLPINTNSLPIIKVPGDELGKISPTISQDLGINNKCKIIAGTTDSIAAFLSTGAHKIGEAVSSIGSTLVVKVIGNNPIYNNKYGIYSHRIGNLWLTGGASNVGGAIIKKLFSNRIDELSIKINPNQSTGLNYYPLIHPGERFPINDPNLQPILEPRPKDEVVFFQGVLEGITRVEKKCYERISQFGGGYPYKIFSVGGGANNEKWNILRANIIKAEIINPITNEAAFGAALLAKGINFDTT
tara:strand:- start:1484 stop:2764 length:1281 start_codon:yes stop_codon:yes gene_type:complete